MSTLKSGAIRVAVYPDVQLDINVDDGFNNIARDGLDARLGESVAEGMTAVVAPPAYKGKCRRANQLRRPR